MLVSSTIISINVRSASIQMSHSDCSEGRKDRTNHTQPRIEKIMKITLYTKPDCTQCRGVKMWLNRHAPDYEVVDVSEDDDARDYILELGYLATPVTVIETNNETVNIQGFYESSLNSAIFNLSRP